MKTRALLALLLTYCLMLNPATASALPRDPAPTTTTSGQHVTIREGYITSHDEYGTKLYYKQNLLENARGNVVIAHGSNEHSGRYEWVTGHLLNAGYNVFRVDHRGHGLSVPPHVDNHIERGFIDDFHNLVDDLDLIVNQAREYNPDVKTFMLGHSMGALAVQFYGIKYPHSVDGIISTGGGAPFNLTGDRTGDDENVREITPEHITEAQEQLAPTLSEEVPMEWLTTFNARLFEDIIQDPQGFRYVSEPWMAAPMPSIGGAGGDITSDPAVNEDYENDPLRNPQRTIAMEIQMAVIAMIYNSVNAPLFVTPTLNMHGDKDQIVPEWLSHDWHAAISSEDKELVIFHGQQHEVLSDYGKDDAIRTVVDWLNARS